MSLEFKDPVFVALALGPMAISILVCIYLSVVRANGPLLQFQPRRPVPWNGVGAVLACMMVSLILLTVIVGEGESTQPSDASSPHAAEQIVSWIGQELFLVGGYLFLIIVYFRPSWSDLGLPSSFRELMRMMGLGLVAGIAALAPVHLLQAGLLYAMNKQDLESGNPLLKTLAEGEPSMLMLVLATIAAVIVAPICEEITFRLLLQGWLERREAEILGYYDPRSPLRSKSGEAALAAPNDVAVDGEATEVSRPALVDPRPFFESQPPLGLAGLPFGWAPILISSVLFGLAHFGYGPEPVPLYLLALMLGYVYQRTHRIIPCIVAHSLFNLSSMILVWYYALHGVH